MKLKAKYILGAVGVVAALFAAVAWYGWVSSHDEPDWLYVDQRCYGMHQLVLERFGRKSSQKATCKNIREFLSPMPEDPWSNKLRFTSLESCSAGGCLYELRSFGPDEVRGTQDDLPYRYLVGDCSNQGFSGVSWKSVSARKVNLSGARFDTSRLTAVDFGSSNLRGASFRDATVGCIDGEGARVCLSFEKADLTDADLRGIHRPEVLEPQIDFEASQLEGARLSGSQLEWADFSSAHVSPAQLGEAEIKRIKCPDGRVVEGSSGPSTCASDDAGSESK